MCIIQSWPLDASSRAVGSPLCRNVGGCCKVQVKTCSANLAQSKLHYADGRWVAPRSLESRTLSTGAGADKPGTPRGQRTRGAKVEVAPPPRRPRTVAPVTRLQALGTSPSNNQPSGNSAASLSFVEHRATISSPHSLEFMPQGRCGIIPCVFFSYLSDALK